MSKKFDTVLVVGAGAFGTSIASVLALNFKKVILKVRSRDVYDSILKKRENAFYLPGLKLEKNIVGVLTWEQFEQECDGKLELVVSGLPTAGIKLFFEENKERFSCFFARGIPLCSLSKGIDPETLELADDLFFDIFPDYRECFAFLSGPSFAKEIMNKEITAVSIAGRSKRQLQKIALMLDTHYFKILLSYDVKGILLGGSLKNILAIAGGIIEGLGYNHNTRAAMITRGIAEMLRFGKVFNARPETFYGLSGMGDLILTTTGDLSRNKSFGLEICLGEKTAAEIISSQRTVVEGYKTVKAAYLLSKKYDIKASIFQGVYRVLYENQRPKDVIELLMKVPSRFEIE